MSVPAHKAPRRRISKWVQRALCVFGAVLLGYSGLVLVDAWLFQRSGSRNIERLLHNQRAASEGGAQSAGNAAAAGDLIGRIEIPRLLLSVVVIEGIDDATLRRAVGHIPGTALPGHPGNVGLAGHRDTFFRPLKNLRIKDAIQFSTVRGTFEYEVESLRVVDPDAVGVLASSGESVLTLVTCYPFYYVGVAPKRFIVRARQVWKRRITS
jgi:sortase A